jgi:hypothetical protein
VDYAVRGPSLVQLSFFLQLSRLVVQFSLFFVQVLVHVDSVCPSFVGWDDMLDKDGSFEGVGCSFHEISLEGGGSEGHYYWW